MSEDAIGEMGDHLARRTARDSYDEGRLGATDQALKSTYTEEEQKRIREYAESNPHPVIPEDHDVWRGNVHTMGAVMGLDPELVSEAGNEAIPAMAATMSYRQLETREAQQEALKAIQQLENAGYRELAFRLRGEVGLSLVQSALVPTSQSEKEIKEQIKNHKALEKAAGIIGNLPGLPRTATIGLKGLEESLKFTNKRDNNELKRRKRRH